MVRLQAPPQPNNGNDMTFVDMTSLYDMTFVEMSSLYDMTRQILATISPSWFVDMFFKQTSQRIDSHRKEFEFSI